MAREREYGLNNIIGARMQSKTDGMRKQLVAHEQEKNIFDKMTVYSFNSLNKDIGSDNCFCDCDGPYECDGCDDPCDGAW